MIFEKIVRRQSEKPFPKRYERALKAITLAAKPYEDDGYPIAYKKALGEIAANLRPATWCEYRRAAVLECKRLDLHDAARDIQLLKQADFTSRRPKKQKKITITADDTHVLLETAGKSGDVALRFALVLCWRYGLRAAELPNLSIDGTHLVIKGAKRTGVRGSNRRIKFHNKEREQFERVVAILAQETSVTLRARLYRLRRKLFPKATIGITFHRIRHQVASDLKRSNVDIVTIAKLLGHRSCKSTNAYGDPRRGSARRGVPPVIAEFEPRPTPEMPPRSKAGPAPSQ